MCLISKRSSAIRRRKNLFWRRIENASDRKTSLNSNGLRKRNSPRTGDACGHETYPIVIGRNVSDASIDISVPRMIYRHANPPINCRLNGNVALHHGANMDAIRSYRWRRSVPSEPATETVIRQTRTEARRSECLTALFGSSV